MLLSRVGLFRQLHRVRAERSGLAPLLRRIEQRPQLSFQHPGHVADLPDRNWLLEAALHRLDLGVVAIDLDDVETTGISTFHNQQTVLAIGAHPIRMLEAGGRGFELRDLARLTARTHPDAEQQSGREGVDVEIAVLPDRDAVKPRSLATAEPWIGRPDLKGVGARGELQDMRLKRFRYVNRAIGTHD